MITATAYTGKNAQAKVLLGSFTASRNNVELWAQVFLTRTITTAAMFSFSFSITRGGVEFADPTLFAWNIGTAQAGLAQICYPAALQSGDVLNVYVASSVTGAADNCAGAIYFSDTLDGVAVSATALSNAIWTDAKAAYVDATISTRSTLAAGAKMDIIDAPNATAITAIQAGLALESTLTAIKGEGWTVETLKSISNALASVGLSAEQIAEIRGGLATEETSRKILEASQAE